MATSEFNYYGTAANGYTAYHKDSRGRVEVHKNSEGQWQGQFRGRPRHPKTGLRWGTGMCPTMKTKGSPFETREAAAAESLRQYREEQAQCLGT